MHSKLFNNSIWSFGKCKKFELVWLSECASDQLVLVLKVYSLFFNVKFWFYFSMAFFRSNFKWIFFFFVFVVCDLVPVLKCVCLNRVYTPRSMRLHSSLSFRKDFTNSLKTNCYSRLCTSSTIVCLQNFLKSSL